MANVETLLWKHRVREQDALGSGGEDECWAYPQPAPGWTPRGPGPAESMPGHASEVPLAPAERAVVGGLRTGIRLFPCPSPLSLARAPPAAFTKG